MARRDHWSWRSAAIAAWASNRLHSEEMVIFAPGILIRRIVGSPHALAREKLEKLQRSVSVAGDRHRAAKQLVAIPHPLMMPSFIMVASEQQSQVWRIGG